MVPKNLASLQAHECYSVAKLSFPHKAT